MMRKPKGSYKNSAVSKMAFGMAKKGTKTFPKMGKMSLKKGSAAGIKKHWGK